MEFWERSVPYLLDALEYAAGTHTIEHVREAIERGDAQLWPLLEGAVVTEIKVYPTGLRSCNIWLAGGKMDDMREVEKMIVDWAKSQGCGRVEITGRRGWARALHGYRDFAHLVKEI